MNKKSLKLLNLILAFIIISFIYAVPQNIYANNLQTAAVTQQKVIMSRKKLLKTFSRHITKLDTDFTITASRKLLKNNNKSFKKFWKDLTKYPEYNEIMENAKITNSVVYSYSDYFVWNVKVKYYISKKNAKELINNINPLITTKKDLIKAMTRHTKKLDENFSINIDKNVIDISNGNEYSTFWDKLYEIPEFNDISRYYKNFSFTQNTYKDYYKWAITTNYDITKEEVKYLRNFVKNWVAENIDSSMTEEEKVRAINDFMVAKYRYTFGDKGQCSRGSESCSDEKLGKYSVYSSFALVYEGGGVCDAKSKLFYRLAREAGLKALYIVGHVNGDTLHSWNMVKVDGNWYHLDNTWNRATRRGMAEHEYFNTRDYYVKSDASMIKGHHTWQKGKYPRANADYPLK